MVASQIKTICKYCIYLVMASIFDWDTVFKTMKSKVRSQILFFNAIVLNVWSKEYLIQTKIELLKNTMDLLPWNQNLRGIQDPTMINYI